MHIFDRKKKAIHTQLELIPRHEKEPYDIRAALSKALLVFMLSYGTVGGFLSAFSVEYNRVFAFVACLVFSHIMAFIYETKIRWFTNLSVIVVFSIYAYVAVSRFWILNSGAYAIINRIYEVAQSYLGITEGGLYQLAVDDVTQAVTDIAVFVEVVLVILMVIRFQYKVSLLRVFATTFLPFLVPIYFERTPGLVEIFFLLAGYITVAITQSSRVKEQLSEQIKLALPVGIAIAGCILLVMVGLMPRSVYRRVVQPNKNKQASEEEVTRYAQYGVMALFMDRLSGGGMGMGKLSQNQMVMPDYKTDLIVRFTPYNTEPVYLKAFTGVTYTGNMWTDASSLSVNEVNMETVTEARKQLYLQNKKLQGKGRMDIINVDLDVTVRPYYVGDDPGTFFTDKDGEFVRQFTYYPDVTDTPLERAYDQPSMKYLEISQLCYDTVQEICQTQKFHGSQEEIAQQIIDYFDENYTYTLRDRRYFGNMDYISYFLGKNKKGRCTHFASGATMLFRYMGIPARYAEGYVFSYTDAVLDGELLSDLSYEDYYDGYTKIGNTGVLQLEIADDHAHAWVEIYLPEKGWVVVDPTPAAEEEDVGNFWDAFLGNNAVGGDEDGNDDGVGGNLENALASGVWIFISGIAAIVLLLIGKWCLRKMRESKLPAKQRLMLEYGRMTGYLRKRHEDFDRLTTPEEELNWIERNYGLEIGKDLKERLYRVVFASDNSGECDLLRKEVLRLRGKIRFGKRKRSPKQGNGYMQR